MRCFVFLLLGFCEALECPIPLVLGFGEGRELFHLLLLGYGEGLVSTISFVVGVRLGFGEVWNLFRS